MKFLIFGINHDLHNDTYNWFQLYMIYFYSMTLHAAEFSFFAVL